MNGGIPHPHRGNHRLSPSCAAKRARSTTDVRKVRHQSGTAVSQERLTGFAEAPKKENE